MVFQPRLCKKILKYGIYITFSLFILYFLDRLDQQWSADEKKTKNSIKESFYSSNLENPLETKNLEKIKTLKHGIKSCQLMLDEKTLQLDHILSSENDILSQNTKKCKTKIVSYKLDIGGNKLKHVKNVLEDVFESTETDKLSEATIIWYWNFPFGKKRAEINAKDIYKNKQFLNSLPGTNFFTTKEYFVTNFRRDYIPEAHLSLSNELRKNRKYKWVIKQKDHRGVTLVKDMSKIGASLPKNTFLQRFIDNVYLIDKHKFDVALYVVLTNQAEVSPTPDFKISDDWLIRFCPEEYNEKNTGGYVIHDEYKHPSEIKDLDFTEDYNGREALLGHFKKKNLPVHNTLQNSFTQIIRDVIYSHTYQIEQSTHNFSTDKETKNTLPIKFFQLVRFDFIIDNNFKVWLMEINMSPNLDSGHFSANGILYERIIEWALRNGVADRC